MDRDPLVAALYAARAIERPEARATDDVLAALLRERGYPEHPAVLAFERSYGGVLLGAGADDDPHADDESDLLGAYACLTEGNHADPRGTDETPDLVPVMYSPNDIIWFLDAGGRAWIEDTIEGPGPAPYARDGDTLVARALLEGLLWRRRDGALDLDHPCGAEIASALGLPPLARASDDLTRWWGDAAMLVVQRDDGGGRTQAVSEDGSRLDRWR